uniref:Uncharacterized protein n=1 Tax=Romanomermis culicivorax TaxID=13658 RepID=A0A915JEW2_ROMCU
MMFKCLTKQIGANYLKERWKDDQSCGLLSLTDGVVNVDSRTVILSRITPDRNKFKKLMANCFFNTVKEETNYVLLRCRATKVYIHDPSFFGEDHASKHVPKYLH